MTRHAQTFVHVKSLFFFTQQEVCSPGDRQAELELTRFFSLLEIKPSKKTGRTLTVCRALTLLLPLWRKKNPSNKPAVSPLSSVPIRTQPVLPGKQISVSRASCAAGTHLLMAFTGNVEQDIKAQRNTVQEQLGLKGKNWTNKSFHQIKHRSSSAGQSQRIKWWRTSGWESPSWGNLIQLIKQSLSLQDKNLNHVNHDQTTRE